MGTQFTPVLQRLRLAYEELQSYEAFLQGEESIARRLDIPLAGDTKPENINSIFRDDYREVDCGVRRLDAVLQPNIPCPFGSFTYPSDVQAEGKTIRVVESLATLKDVSQIACQIIQTTHKCQARLNERFATELGKVGLKGERGITETSCVTIQTKTEKCRRRPWKQADLDRLPQWFQQYEYLRSDKVRFEAQFKKDFGEARTAAAIKSAYYRAKRRTQRRPEDSSRSSSTISPSLQLPPPVLEPPVSFPKTHGAFSMVDNLSGGATRMLVRGSPHAPHTREHSYTKGKCNRRHRTLDWQSSQTPETSSAWNYHQGTTFRYAIQNDPPTGSVEQRTAINQFGCFGKQLNGNLPSPPSSLSPPNRSWFNAPVVLGQHKLDDEKILTTNKLPPLVNTSTNYQVVPSISFIS